MTRKSLPPNNLGLLDEAQQRELAKFQRDFKTVLPQMRGLAQTAKAVHQGMVNAPVWKVADAPKPDAPVQEPGVWSVGHAKINYVDHIETNEGAEPK